MHEVKNGRHLHGCRPFVSPGLIYLTSWFTASVNVDPVVRPPTKGRWRGPTQRTSWTAPE
jgi:hypothetical protein